MKTNEFFIYFPKETVGLFCSGHFFTFITKVQFFMTFIYFSGVTVVIIGERSSKKRNKLKL